MINSINDCCSSGDVDEFILDNIEYLQRIEEAITALNDAVKLYTPYEMVALYLEQLVRLNKKNSLKSRCFLCGETLEDWEQHKLRFSDRFSSKIGRVCTFDYAEHLSKADKYIVTKVEKGEQKSRLKCFY